MDCNYGIRSCTVKYCHNALKVLHYSFSCTHSHTHPYTNGWQPPPRRCPAISGATRGSMSCSRTLQHVDSWHCSGWKAWGRQSCSADGSVCITPSRWPVRPWMWVSGSWAAGESRQPAVALATLAQLFASGWMLGTMHYSGLWSKAAGSSREGRIAFRRVSRANKQNKAKPSSRLELMDQFIYVFICLDMFFLFQSN